MTPVALVATYALALVSFRSEPSGYVRSTPAFLHASTDVLEFSHGSVTLRTCCGDQWVGTCSRSADGVWVWQMSHKPDAPAFKQLYVRPGLFSMTFTDAANSSESYTLRRRVFKRWDL
jgi:hypothetical protein